MECPSETTLSDFLGGLLPEEERARLVAHVEGCAGCLRAVAAGTSSAPGLAASGGAEGTLEAGATLSRYGDGGL